MDCNNNQLSTNYKHIKFGKWISSEYKFKTLWIHTHIYTNKIDKKAKETFINGPIWMFVCIEHV